MLPKEFPKCRPCGSNLSEDKRVSAWWKKIGARADFCLTCFGEIFFNILPKMTSHHITTRAGTTGWMRGKKAKPVGGRERGGPTHFHENRAD